METLRLIFDKNPGLLSILFTGVLLPLGILWLTNLQSRKQKETDKSFDVKYNSKEDLKHQERMVYAALSKILFQVQQLHDSLTRVFTESGDVTNAVTKFDKSISGYHNDIADNMLYLSSPAINLIYKFYSQISELRAELRKINDSQAFDLTPVAVFYSSQRLADTVIQVQEIFVKELSNLKVQFNKTQQEVMRNFCGSPPSEVLIIKYEQFKQQKLIQKH